MDIKELIREKSVDDLKKILMVEPKTLVDSSFIRETEKYRDEFNNERTRRITSVGNKPDFEVVKYSETEYTTDPITGRKIFKEIGKETEPSTKLVFPFPKVITETAVAFLFGGTMSVSTDTPDERFYEFRNYLEKSLRLKSLLKKFARVGLVETKAALLFYIRPKTSVNEEKIKAVVLNLDSGEFFPTFDEYGDMVAFTRNYTTSLDGETVEMFEVFTAESIYQWSKKSGDWQQLPVIKNPFGKIPVVYYEQDLPIWEDVVSLIDKYEMRLSRLSDTNDYFSEPIALIFGDPINLPEKGKSGKVLHFRAGQTIDGKPENGDAKYLTWDHSPAAIELELRLLKQGIYDMTNTPDLSFESLKGLGNIANFGVRLMFVGAEIKRQKLSEEFDVAIERVINIMKAGFKIIRGIDLSDTSIDIKFGSILPNDLKDELEILGQAVQDGILSKETAVSINKLVTNPAEEIEKIRKDQEESGFSLIAGSGE